MVPNTTQCRIMMTYPHDGMQYPRVYTSLIHDLSQLGSDVIVPQHPSILSGLTLQEVSPMPSENLKKVLVSLNVQSIRYVHISILEQDSSALYYFFTTVSQYLVNICCYTSKCFCFDKPRSFACHYGIGTYAFLLRGKTCNATKCCKSAITSLNNGQIFKI